MSMTVHPDPQEPAGGFAFLELPDRSLPDGPVMVAVFDAYGERWLAPSENPGDRIEVGNPNWQSERVDFGPYEVHRHEGADWVRIGPEIVNKLAEYAPLRITVGEQTYDVGWPDNVPPRTGAAVLGGVQPVARKQTGLVTEKLVGKMQAAPEKEAPSASKEPPQPVEEGPETETETETRSGSLWVLVILLAALVILGAAVWYFWPGAEPENNAETAGEPCSLASLASIRGGFGETVSAIRDCGAEVSADTALQLAEEAIAREDAEALLLFGVLYDGNELDPRIENLIGLTFEDDPAQAVEYYARAVRAGSATAADRLAATCERLSASAATLAKGAYDDFCS